MFRNLYWKLTLAFILVAFATTALVAVFIRITSADRLTQLIIDQQISSLQTALSTYYTSNGSWNNVAQSWPQMQFRTFPTPAAQTPSSSFSGNHLPGNQDQRGEFGLADAQGIVVVSVDPNYPMGSTVPQKTLLAGDPVTVGGKRVGTILRASQPPGFNTQETQFLQRTNDALIYAVAGSLLVALMIGILLSRTLTRPLKALTEAAHRISQGKLEQQVIVKSNDEIGQLAAAFNRMSQEVAHENQLRRQMTADIAHDLRTPLTVISGYIESMRDGVLKPTPQRLSLIYSEIERLQNMVGDLRMLSLADAGELSLNPQQISPKTLLDKAAALFKHQAEQQNVTIAVKAAGDLPEIRVDEARMVQVFGNLITNALRYTPPEGKITLSAQLSGSSMEICIQDTGAGIDPEELPYIFERFHRSDESRHTEAGESGLGLAIVKALIESHGGTVSAESTSGQGTTIHMLIPTGK
jgi:signal transduction histidine kinase